MDEDVYADFIAEVLTGDFAAPPGGEWSAAQIAAHVGRNQEELITTTERILTGDFASYDNRNTTGETELERYIVAYQSLAGLADRIAQTSVALREVAARLAERQGDNPVSIPVFIQDGDKVVVDQPTPWHEILKIDEKVHVRMHLEQLQALDRRRTVPPPQPAPDLPNSAQPNSAQPNSAQPKPGPPKPAPPKPGPPRSRPPTAQPPTAQPPNAT
jgi:hypothetical protein